MWRKKKCAKIENDFCGFFSWYERVKGREEKSELESAEHLKTRLQHGSPTPRPTTPCPALALAQPKPLSPVIPPPL